MTQPLNLLTSFSHRKSAIFVISGNTDNNCILIQNFKFFWPFLVLQVFLTNIIAILMIPAKLLTPGLIKIKVFWGEAYDVIISVHNVTNKTLSRYSTYIAYVVIWPKFINFSISVREFLYEFDQKNWFFLWGGVSSITWGWH